jgi:hydrogenase/urease accessory protein HupE
MDNAVTQEVFKRIDVLAEKMGVTAQYLWPKLVAHTQGVAAAQVLLGAIGIVVGAVGLYWSVKRGVQEEWDTPLEFIGACAFGILLLFLFVAACTEGPANIATIVSPEAAAFYKLVGR